MKLLIVNGFRKEYDLTFTTEKLKEKYKVNFCMWDQIKDIQKFIHKTNPDLIIASSEAALFVTDYDIPMILLQPVVDKKELKKLYPNENFDFLPDKPSKKASFIEILINEEDRILDKEKIKKYFADKCIKTFIYDDDLNGPKNVFPILISEKVKIFQIFKEKKFDFVDPLIVNNFTTEELKEILVKAVVWDNTEIILFEGLGVCAYSDGIKMFDYNTEYEFKTKEEFLEAVKKIKPKNNCEEIFLKF